MSVIDDVSVCTIIDGVGVGIDINVSDATTTNTNVSDPIIRSNSLLPLFSLFFFTRVEWTLELTIDQKVVEDTRGRPGDAVGPAFDSRGMFVEDEDGARLD